MLSAAQVSLARDSNPHAFVYDMRCDRLSLWAGVKAQKKKGLQPRAINVPYLKTYGLPAMNGVAGFVHAQPLARPHSGMPIVAAVPVRWQMPVALE